MLQEPNYTQLIATLLNLKTSQVQIVLELTAEWSTVPFIARYRKERTGNLDEDMIRQIIAEQTKAENLFKAKLTAINGIEEQGQMTPELMEKITSAETTKQVEEIYKPYKLKKKTKAMIAIEKWFQPIADMIKEGKEPVEFGSDFTELKKEYSEEEILEGASHIISAEVSSDTHIRHDLKLTLSKKWNILSKLKGPKMLAKLNEKDTAQIKKFDIYADFSAPLWKLKPYQVLALSRGEKLGILNVKLEKTDEFYDDTFGGYLHSIKNTKKTSLLEDAFSDGFTALFKSLDNEIRSDLSELAEDDAMESFRTNLDALLMTKPVYGQTILAVDPGFRAGCKIVVLDTLGTPVLFDKIYLHQKSEAKQILKNIINKTSPDVIVLGNGTWVNETQDIIQEITGIDIYIVNESGASVYSVSKIWKEEFPDLDSLDRGTISIGRRYIDPLSELVKVPVESIGVGMYQHDMPVKKLEEKLGYTVEDVVNRVGIPVNTASSYVLNHISGIDKRTAKKIFSKRPYASRVELKKVLSDKVYEQAIGFLRVPESDEKLDNTDIHPEQYELAKFFIENKWDMSAKDFFENYESKLTELYTDANASTLEFISEAYADIGLEKRVYSTHKKASAKLNPDDIKEGMVLEGTVRNVVAFGAFVDIWLKSDGLVHVSQIANRFVSNPADELTVWEKVQVKILSMENGKIQLSIKEA